MLGHIGHSAPLPVCVHGMEWCPQRASELLRKLIAKTLHADMPWESFVDVLLDLETQFERQKEIALRQTGKGLLEVGPLQQFEDISLVAFKVVLHSIELRIHLEVVDGIPTHLHFNTIKQRLDHGSVQKSFQLDESVSLELHLLLSGDAKLVVKGVMLTHMPNVINPSNCDKCLSADTGAEIDIQWKLKSGVLVAALVGHVDGCNAEEFQRFLNIGIEPGDQSLIFDVEHLSFIGSVGLRVSLIMTRESGKPDKQLGIYTLSLLSARLLESNEYRVSGKSLHPCSLRFFERKERIGNAEVNFCDAQFYDRSVSEDIADYDFSQHVGLWIDRYRYLP